MNRRYDYRLAIPLATLMAVAVVGLGVSRCSMQAMDHGARLQVETDAPEPRAARPAQEQELAIRFREGVMMLHARRYDYAVTALHRVLELAPSMPEAHANMGFALLGLEQYTAARDFFAAAIELRPQQVNAYWGLAESLEALCDIAGATGAMRSYIHLTPGGDPFLPRARAALWEWETLAANQETAAGIPGMPGDPGAHCLNQ
ncbi:MAG: tetratricopeptide repeat protein [Thiohalobacterales bacterium]|nr:tetratricopeptide repeat protein [Thiohalobacterales bacterium]